ncbi:MAG: hypothetical protein LBN71_08765, partial [Tannerella sp.]|nr:hypothetical protein [Tannerella sp.]
MEEFAPSQLIKNAVIVNEGVAKNGTVLIRDGKIADIFEAGIPEELLKSDVVQYDAEGKYLLPGVI